jgi:predicted nucleotidyltransferase
VVPTTLFVSEKTRDDVNAAKKVLGAKNVDSVIQTLLGRAAPSASELFVARRRLVMRVCSRYGIRRLTAFGSRTREDRRLGSDLDLVAVIPSGGGLFALMEIEEELGRAFGCKVDLTEWPRAESRLMSEVRRDGVALIGPKP